MFLINCSVVCIISKPKGVAQVIGIYKANKHLAKSVKNKYISFKELYLLKIFLLIILHNCNNCLSFNKTKPSELLALT